LRALLAAIASHINRASRTHHGRNPCPTATYRAHKLALHTRTLADDHARCSAAALHVLTTPRSKHDSPHRRGGDAIPIVLLGRGFGLVQYAFVHRRGIRIHARSQRLGDAAGQEHSLLCRQRHNCTHLGSFGDGANEPEFEGGAATKPESEDGNGRRRKCDQTCDGRAVARESLKSLSASEF